MHQGSDLLVVDPFFLTLRLRIGQESRETTLLVAIYVIVDRELFLQQREDHLGLLGDPSIA
jgi:hypothetical protein